MAKSQGSQKEHCVVIVGAGFGGFNAVRELSRIRVLADWALNAVTPRKRHRSG